MKSGMPTKSESERANPKTKPHPKNTMTFISDFVKKGANMAKKIRKCGTLQAAVDAKDKSIPEAGECKTRKMTPEDWAKYGPYNPDKKPKVNKEVGL
jgi:hypothetical protein